MDSSDEDEIEYEEEAFEVLGRTLRVMTVAPLPLSVLATLTKEDSEISGQRVWAGSLLLAHFLGRERRGELAGAARLLELGCGSGIAGMALAASLEGALEVFMTDGDPKAIELLADNVALNDLGDEAAAGGSAQVAELFWGDDASMAAFEASRGGDGDAGFPLVVAGDVLYKRGLIEPLLTTVRRFLAPGGTFYLCHIPRFDVYHDVVAAALADKGWAVREVLEPEDVIARHAVPESWDEDTMSDLRRAKIYVLQAEPATGEA